MRKWKSYTNDFSVRVGWREVYARFVLNGLVRSELILESLFLPVFWARATLSAHCFWLVATGRAASCLIPEPT